MQSEKSYCELYNESVVAKNATTTTPIRVTAQGRCDSHHDVRRAAGNHFDNPFGGDCQNGRGISEVAVPPPVNAEVMRKHIHYGSENG